MQVVVSTILVTSHQVPRTDLTIGGVKLLIWSDFPSEKIELSGSLPNRRYRLRHYGNDQGLEVDVDHYLPFQASWRVGLSGRRVDQAIQAIRNNPYDIPAIMTILRPLREYVERNCRFVPKKSK